MRRRRGRIPPEVAHAAKVAVAASLFVGIVYAGCVAVLDKVVTARLTQSVDERLEARLADAQELGPSGSYGDNEEADSTPVYFWRETPSGPVAEPGSHGPALPAGLRIPRGHDHAVTTRLASGRFRLMATNGHGVTL